MNIENNKTHIKSKAGVYAIYCLDFNKKYVDETSCNLQKWIYAHKRNLKKGNIKKIVCLDNLETYHFNWNHFEMRLLNLRINFYLLTFCPHLGSFLRCFFFHYVSAKFYLWPSSGDLPRPRIGMLNLVTVSPVITAFHSCCLSHHVFDHVNLWPAWVGFETAIFWQCSPEP